MKIGKMLWHAEMGSLGKQPIVTVEWSVEGTDEEAHIIFLFPENKDLWLKTLEEMQERALFCRYLYRKHNKVDQYSDQDTVH